MKKVKELLDTFLSKPPEIHAAAAGSAAGGFLGLTWGTPMQELAIGIAGAIILCALGIKKLSNRKIGKEIRLEAQYALGFLCIAFAIGLGINIWI